MPFCFECGDELKGTGKLLSCNSCGWSSDSIQNIGNSVKPKSCPDCGKMGKTMRQCGVCRETWFCSWCHSQRKRDIREIFARTNGLYYSVGGWNKTYDGYLYFDDYKKLKLITSFDAYEPCLECSKKLIVKLTDNVIPKIMEYEGSDSRKKRSCYNIQKQVRKIQLALGFNKAAMFNSPLD